MKKGKNREDWGNGENWENRILWTERKNRENKRKIWKAKEIKKIMNMGETYRENRQIKNKGKIREPNKENREKDYGK